MAGISETERIFDILVQNSQKGFVKRILNPSAYPTLANPDGSSSTHSMAWSSADEKHYVYPTVVMGKKGLRRLSDKGAWKYARKTGNLIEFSTPEEADWFSKKYKRLMFMQRGVR